MAPIHLALSTCPNDTFLIHGLYSGAVDARGLDLRLHFGDVQELNEGLRAGRFQVSKGSYALALQLGRTCRVLRVGSALGFGVGPLLLARPDWQPDEVPKRVLCPGADTTATLLFRALYPEGSDLHQVVFSDIMPALQRGEADWGVCIHEGRFTYAESGLRLVADLGKRFESAAQSPLPLGGLFAGPELEEATLQTLEAVLADSLRYGWQHRNEAAETMGRFAQELSRDVMDQHVDLYVNAWTADLGEVGARAIARLGDFAERAGWMDPSIGRPTILSGPVPL